MGMKPAGSLDERALLGRGRSTLLTVRSRAAGHQQGVTKRSTTICRAGKLRWGRECRMFSEAPEFCGAIYGALMDYDAKTERAAQLLREVAPALT